MDDAWANKLPPARTRTFVFLLILTHHHCVHIASCPLNWTLQCCGMNHNQWMRIALHTTKWTDTTITIPFKTRTTGNRLKTRNPGLILLLNKDRLNWSKLNPSGICKFFNYKLPERAEFLPRICRCIISMMMLLLIAILYIRNPLIRRQMHLSPLPRGERGIDVTRGNSWSH